MVVSGGIAMHRRTLLGIGLAVLLAAPADAAERCALKGAETIAANAGARVFSVPGKGETKRRIYGCLTGRRPILLAGDVTPKAADEAHIANEGFRLGGSWVGWRRTTSSDFGAGEYASAIVVRSLGRARRKVEQDISRYGLKQLRIAPNGAVAWVLA